jgi:hypothetical protein
MRSVAYEIGNKVTLRVSGTQSVLKSRVGQIVGLLPGDRGEARYRVRVEGETFERCVLATDIEHAETGTDDVPEATDTGPWLKPLSARRGR